MHRCALALGVQSIHVLLPCVNGQCSTPAISTHSHGKGPAEDHCSTEQWLLRKPSACQCFIRPCIPGVSPEMRRPPAKPPWIRARACSRRRRCNIHTAARPTLCRITSTAANSDIFCILTYAVGKVLRELGHTIPHNGVPCLPMQSRYTSTTFVEPLINTWPAKRPARSRSRGCATQLGVLSPPSSTPQPTQSCLPHLPCVVEQRVIAA